MGWSINAKSVEIPEGAVKKIVAGGATLWEASNGVLMGMRLPTPKPEPDPDEPTEEFVCPTCGKTYTSETWYNKHLLTHIEE